MTGGRRTAVLLAVLAGLMLIGDAAAWSRSQRKALTEIQEVYAAAIRWSDIDAADAMLDPEYRAEHPLTDLERARYEQVQISGYRELRSSADGEDRLQRDVEIRVINRNTQAERTVRVRESWRWDPQGKRWWLASGLPDLWNGQ